MDKYKKRIDFLNNLNRIKNHMNWYKLKINPADHEIINDLRIEYDYIPWEAENDSIIEQLSKIENFDNLSFIDRILQLHLLVCKHFVFDDFCYFLGRYDKEKNVCLIDQKYGRNPNSRWIEERKKHNRRICFELSRYVAVRIKQIANEECDVFLVSDEYESHYGTAVVSNDFMITIDTDDFIKGEDLNRVKLDLEIKGITIVSDENGVVIQAVEKENKNRKTKKDFEHELEENSNKNNELEWIYTLLGRINVTGNDGVFKYMEPILNIKGYEPKKIWQKNGDIYDQTLYIAWGMKYLVIRASGMEILNSKKFFDNIQDGTYLPNKNRGEIAKEIVYNG